MIRRFLVIAPLTALAACAYATDSSVQDVKFVTPGATGAECRVYVEKVKYVVHPPQTVNLFKSGKDMEVDCLAPGNRRQRVFIEPGIEGSSAWNLANGGVGYAWDYASGALWRYPDVIEVNFTDAPVTNESLPGHNSAELPPPEDRVLEEFLPGQPRMNADRYAQPVEILRRQKNAGTASVPYDDAAAFSENPAPRQDKGDLMKAAPSVKPAEPAPAKAAPAPLFPGE